MADLVTDIVLTQQNGTGQIQKTPKGKSKGTIVPEKKEVIANVTKIDETLGSGFSEDLLKIILAKSGELQSIASHAMQTEYMMQLAVNKAQEKGTEQGRAKADAEIRAKKIEALRIKAEDFMKDFEQFFNSLLMIGMTFEEAKKHITDAAQQHYIEVEISTTGDSEIEWEWKFKLTETEQ